jgi:hypothetical protein
MDYFDHKADAEISQWCQPCQKSEDSLEKATDFLDLRHESDPEKRIKTIGKAGVLPGDKKSVDMGSDASGTLDKGCTDIGVPLEKDWLSNEKCPYCDAAEHAGNCK